LPNVTHKAEQYEAGDAALAVEPECGAPRSRTKMLVGAAVLAVLAVVYWGASEANLISGLSDMAHLRAQVDAWGLWGPFFLILAMAAAIVFSPIPSGPIAVVAGAAYGPLLGTALVVAGSLLGAVAAFSIARCIGYETLRCWPAARRMLHKLDDGRSQTRLMALVFFSRLVPFVSFDAVSYVAGLTPLAFWRFGLATFAGVVPVSFALAYFGDQITAAASDTVMLLLLLAGGVTLVPFAVRAIRKKKQGKI
jgi:uncharacterized membrane protein YdjX (TVP38/TMEM64 family)